MAEEQKSVWKQCPATASAPWFYNDSGLFLKAGQNAKGNTTLVFQFWRKGEKFGENRDDMIALPIDVVTSIDKALAQILVGENGRVKKYKDGTKDYDLLNNYEWYLLGKPDANGVNKSYATIKIDTIDIEGVARVRLNVIKGDRINSIVFFDKNASSTVHEENCVRAEYDVAEMSFMRFCREIHSFLDFAPWVLPALSAIYNAVLRNGGGNVSVGFNKGGNNNSYKTNNYISPKPTSSPVNELGFEEEDY
jgi:hypothetical protein